MRRLAACAALLSLLSAPAPAASDPWEDTLDRVVPAVVALRVSGTRAFDTDPASVTVATGFVVDARLGSVVINSSLKERFWPNTSALGKRMSVAGIGVQVVGVVGDVHTAGLDVEAPQVLYLPMLDVTGAPPLMAVGAMTITVRTSVEPLSVVPAIRGAIAELDADLPIANVRSMQDVVGTSLSRTSTRSSLPAG